MAVNILSDIKNGSRLANFELLRVISMVMVTTLHALGHGGVLEQYEFGSLGYIFMWFIETLSYVSVNLFVLITGYFMINSNFKISRIIKLSVQIEFYSVVCLIISKYILHEQICIEEIVRAVFPLTGGIYWFASSYVVIVALSPLLNKLIHSIGKNEHFFACVLLFMIFCFTPTFLFWSRDVLSNGSDFIWFIALYFTAAYISLYSNETFFECTPRKYFVLYIIFCLIALCSRLIIGQASKIAFGEIKFESIFYSYNSVIVFGASVCLFLFFKNIEIKSKILSKTVTRIGSVCFGAYLYSDNPFLRKPLWDFVNLPQMVREAKWGGIALLIAVVFIIFLIGCLIESIRNNIFNMLGVSKLVNKVDALAEKIINRSTLFSNDTK